MQTNDNAAPHPVRPPRPQKDIRKEILNRSLVLYYVFVGIALVIIGRMLWIQYSPEGAELRKEAEGNISFNVQRTLARRGDILSHDGRILATTMPLFHLYMDFRAEGLTPEKFSANVDSLSLALAGFFKDKSARAYRDSLVRWHRAGLRYKRITPRRMNYIEMKELCQAPLLREGRNQGGVITDTTYRRTFPYGSLARRTIGSVNETGTKVGIEGSFDEILAGEDGHTRMQKISGNFWMPVKDERNVSPVDGCDVQTTIDIDVQEVAEAKLREQLASQEALWGTAILMEVSTGEIRAIANLSRKENGDIYEDYNYAIGMNMEPGSTFKLASLMALLDDAKASPYETVDTEGGVVRIGAAKVVDSHAGGFGVINFLEMFEKSSNTGFAKAVNRYYARTPGRFTDYLYKIGLNEPFGLQIKGETAPVIRRPGDKLWNGTTLTMMSFGYAVMLSPIHTLALYNAVANDGKYMKPLFVTAIKQGDRIVERIEPQVLNAQICSDQTLRWLKQALEGVVNDGTAKVLRNDHYRVAGKTGTAQVAKGRSGYTVNGGRYYLATVVGYFPADKPKYSCIVAIETFHPFGSSNIYYGGALAGPVFRAIADKVYSQATDWADKVQKPLLGSTTKRVTVENSVKAPEYEHPFVRGGDRRRLDNVLSELNIREVSVPNRHRDGLVAVDSGFRMRELPEVSSGVPDVTGLPLREAVYLLETRGFRTETTGKGTVRTQVPAPGAAFVRGDTIRLTLEL